MNSAFHFGIGRWTVVWSIWAFALVTLLCFGVRDQINKRNSGNEIRTNALPVETPLGILSVQTGAVLYFPGVPIDLIIESSSVEAKRIDSVHYELRRIDGGAAVLTGVSRLDWVLTQAGVESRVPNLFPIAPQSVDEGQRPPPGKYELFVELRSTGNVVGVTHLMPIRVELQKHY